MRGGRGSSSLLDALLEFDDMSGCVFWFIEVDSLSSGVSISSAESRLLVSSTAALSC